MAVTHVITTSAFEFGNRIDAELYQSRLKSSYQKLCASGLEIKVLRGLLPYGAELRLQIVMMD